VVNGWLSFRRQPGMRPHVADAADSRCEADGRFAVQPGHLQRHAAGDAGRAVCAGGNGDRPLPVRRKLRRAAHRRGGGRAGTRHPPRAVSRPAAVAVRRRFDRHRLGAGPARDLAESSARPQHQTDGDVPAAVRRPQTALRSGSPSSAQGPAERKSRWGSTRGSVPHTSRPR
jgi:hypothetical protein